MEWNWMKRLPTVELIRCWHQTFLDLDWQFRATIRPYPLIGLRFLPLDRNKDFFKNTCTLNNNRAIHTETRVRWMSKPWPFFDGVFLHLRVPLDRSKYRTKSNGCDWLIAFLLLESLLRGVSESPVSTRAISGPQRQVPNAFMIDWIECTCICPSRGWKTCHN